MQFNQTSSFYRTQKEKLAEHLGSFKKKSHEEYMILVADAAAIHLINTLFTELDIYKMGFYVTESLENRGRPTKKYVCVYLISPYTDKFELIVADYKDSPKYDAMYILALGTIPDDGITLLKSHKAVKEKLRGLSQIQMDYVPWLDNGYTLMMSGGFRKGTSHEWMRLTASKLTSVLLSMQKFSSFQILYPEQLEEFSQKLQKSLQRSLKILKKYNSQALESTHKPIKVLLFPRQLDYQSPMVRSYDYVSMIFDVLKVQFNTVKVQGKTVALDDEDIILRATKHMDINEACEYIQRLSEGLTKKSAQSETLSNKQLLQMMDKGVLRELIKTHQNIASQINQQGLKLMSASILQQTIVNGITQSGQKVKDREVIESIIQFLKTKQGLTELTFGQLIALCCFSLNIKKDEFDQVLKLCPIGAKVKQKIQTLQVNPTKLKEKETDQRKDLFRHEPRVVQFYKKHHDDSSGLRVRNVGGDQKLSKKRQKHDNQTKTVLFVTDYIGVNQIVALSRESNDNLIVGSNCIVSPWGYLLELIDDK